MSKNDKKYFYKTFAMSNDINLGDLGVKRHQEDFHTVPLGSGKKLNFILPSLIIFNIY